MKIARIGPVGQEIPVLVGENGQLRDLRGIVDDISSQALGDGLLDRIRQSDIGALPLIPASGVRFGPPVADVGKIICIGLNYTDHAAEVGLDLPGEPTVFMKGCRPSGANDPVRLPRGAEKGDWEVELGIVIGKPGMYIEEEQAVDHVAGYCLFNDLTERSYQMELGGQWTKGKSFPGFAPMGPWLVTGDEIANPENLAIWLEVNGHRHQDGTTANLVFGVAAIVSYLSRFYALEPGDLIVTGTPAGVGLGHKPPVFLKPGDVVHLGIDGLGEQRQTILAWED
ncbi:fumarylacetoacetate hydrolase family protein [Novosphingobium sp. KACC 22771]|uniref:fumarylacetoacetate hydrolase family protein n=1 Tax=Novosphingobium sp. KACC 22771 TaxID=3025670 RepID=UPI0023664181|nr:fumarylacetoacetate hydrolase family protein [Novosphingobium sp. KACC 22771]WDF72549.1 fumarylacetoacetate hydrolase family protein [Novosphingobium sp. KACC 22771]